MKKIFDEKQLKAIDLLAEGNKTYIEVSKEVGVDAATLRRWRREPDFQDAVRDECRRLLKQAEPDLYAIALQHAKKKGSFQHIKLLLERLERLEDIADGRGPAYDVMFTWKKRDGEGTNSNPESPQY